MRQQNVPDRERWLGWVGLAWALAAVACLAGIYLIAEYGFIEVPSSNRFVTYREPNIMIWSMAIGQAVGSVFVAVIVHMIYSIHQNTCDQLAEMVRPTSHVEPNGGAQNTPEMPKSGKGIRLTNVQSTSPLRAVLHTGCLIEKVNDQAVDNVEWAEDLIEKGPNKFEFHTPAGERHIKWINLKPGPWLVEGEAADIPRQE